MTIARIGLSLILGVCVAAGSIQVSWGQILSSAPDSASGEVQQAGGIGSELGEVKQAGWPSIPLPKITMPKITMPRLWPSAEDDRPALLSPFIVGAAKVSQGTKKAWEGTKEIFSVGGKSASVAPQPARQSGPSFWQRLIGGSPQQLDEGAQTMGEFISQKRPHS